MASGSERFPTGRVRTTRRLRRDSTRERPPDLSGNHPLCTLLPVLLRHDAPSQRVKSPRDRVNSSTAERIHMSSTRWLARVINAWRATRNATAPGTAPMTVAGSSLYLRLYFSIESTLSPSEAYERLRSAVAPRQFWRLLPSSCPFEGELRPHERGGFTVRPANPYSYMPKPDIRGRLLPGTGGTTITGSAFIRLRFIVAEFGLCLLLGGSTARLIALHDNPHPFVVATLGWLLIVWLILVEEFAYTTRRALRRLAQIFAD